MQVLIIVLLITVGIGLFLLEIFFLPGVGVGAIGGIAFTGGSFWYCNEHYGLDGIVLLLVFAVLLFGLGLWLLHRYRALDRIALDVNIDATVGPENNTMVKIGDEGTTLSRLNPMGQVKFGALNLEAKSERGFIEPGTVVRVISVTDTILVEPK